MRRTDQVDWRSRHMTTAEQAILDEEHKHGFEELAAHIEEIERRTQRAEDMVDAFVAAQHGMYCAVRAQYNHVRLEEYASIERSARQAIVDAMVHGMEAEQ